MADGLDPIVWMYAAVEAVSKGDAGEIEGVWDVTDEENGTVTSIRLTVRREVQHIHLDRG